jgi:hypothetical protein
VISFKAPRKEVPLPTSRGVERTPDSDRIFWTKFLDPDEILRRLTAYNNHNGKNIYS